MLRKNKIFTLIIFTLTIPQVFGENCGHRETALYYANGMFNSRIAARISSRSLSAVANHQVRVAYNLNEDALTELIQVAEQKGEELAKLFWRNLAGEIPIYNPITGEESYVLDAVRKKMLDLAKKFDRDRYQRDPDLRMHVSAYKEDLQMGKYISVVAHSQGNFYANSAGEMLGPEAKSHYTVFAVATPTSTVYNDGPYLTSRRDLVIGAVIKSSGALPPNFKNEVTTPSAHEFEQYLLGDRSRRLFQELLKSIMWNDDESEPSPSHLEPSYVHETLRGFWRYSLNSLYDAPRKLEAHECLAILMFAKTYGWWGESCEKRDIQSVTKLMNDCRATDWKEKLNSSFYCGLKWQDGGIPHIGDLTAAIQEKHDECFSSLTEGGKTIIEINFNRAMELLTHPPRRPTPRPQPIRL